jgi:surface antigen/predicted nuclease with TOPRIM domain
MLKQKHTLNRFYNVRSVVAALLLAGLVSGAAIVHADQYSHQIEVLQSDSSARQGKVDGLETQASSYQDQINRYQSQISSIEAAISENQAKQTDLQNRIEADQKKLDLQKAYLRGVIRTLYVDGQLSTIEELATSKNLNEYVDKEEYRITIQNNVDSTIKEIAALQKQLKEQKAELDDLIASQQRQYSRLSESKSKQQELLSYNQSQQSAFNRVIAKNSARIEELRRLQRAANATFSVGAVGSGPTCGGGYPARWCNVPQDSVLDTWGMYNRECVSYAAFRVAASGRFMPGWGWSAQGNANQWDDNARAAGIPMSFGSGARAGDVAIKDSQPYGHAMYVDSVNGDGTINISQYNVNLDGRYSTNTISQAGLYFIHF